jgi:hypothetical protein
MRFIGLLSIVAASAGAVGCGGGGGTSTVPAPDPSQLGLRSPPAKLVNACHDLATNKLPADTSLPLVYCPPAVPRGDLTLVSVGPFGRGDTHTYYINVLSPSLPHPYIERARKKGTDYPPPGHWLVSASRPPSDQRSFLRDEGARRVGSEEVGGVSATVQLVPSGAAAEDSGHAVVYWQFHGVGYTASVHGHTNRGGRGGDRPRLDFGNGPLPKRRWLTVRLRVGHPHFGAIAAHRMEPGGKFCFAREAAVSLSRESRTERECAWRVPSRLPLLHV